MTIRILLAALGLSALAACTAAPVADTCSPPLHHNLDAAMADAEGRLAGGCAPHFDRYFQHLLAQAKDSPSEDHRQAFSGFLVRTSDQGVISKRQAKDLYNRYFNVKFVSLAGDFNTCSQVCPDHGAVLRAMADELSDKELGLMHISGDRGAYYAADNLYQQSHLVLEATCNACAGSGS